MYSVYLSPSTQENNYYVTGGTEEYYMNLVADATEPYLRASGISYNRNTPQMTAASSIRASNAGGYDIHVAMHSNAAPDNIYGQRQGSVVYYSPNSTNGKRLADIFVKNIKTIYPNPQLVSASPTRSLGEVTKTKAPAVLVEYAYHDNIQDAEWIKDNINEMGRITAKSIAEYFGLPLFMPFEATGVVSTTSGALNVRSKPNTQSEIIDRLYNDTEVKILGKWQDWYTIKYGNKTGYVNLNYIDII